jgi:transposase
VSAIPSWLLEPLWEQFSALLPARPVYGPAHPLGCHRPRVSDRIIFEKLIRVLRFGCSYQSIADCTCGATTIRERRDEWIKGGIFARLKTIAREPYDRKVGLVLEELAVDGCITKAPGGGECAGRSPVDRGKLGMKRSVLVEGRGIPLGRVLTPAGRKSLHHAKTNKLIFIYFYLYQALQDVQWPIDGSSITGVNHAHCC